MPADMKNLVCWPKGSKECWWGKLEACDYSLKHAALCMTSCLCMTRTSTVTSRQWSYVRMARVKPRDGNALAKEGGGRCTITRRSVRDVDSSVLDPPPRTQSITVIHSGFTPESKHWARSIAANDGTSRNMNIFPLLNTCLNLHHYFVGLGISSWPEQNSSFYGGKKDVGLREVINPIMNSGFCKVNLQLVEMSNITFMCCILFPSLTMHFHFFKLARISCTSVQLTHH